MQQIQITYLLQRFLPNGNEWMTIQSGYKTEKSINKVYKRAAARHPELQYRIAEQKEITTISVERIIRGIEGNL